MDLGSDKKKIAIFGGGRWARVLLKILLENTNSSYTFTVHTKYLDNILSWASDNNFSSRLIVSNKDPVLADGSYKAAIVANSARSHKKKTIMALNAKIPVLVEKPMTLSFEDTQMLINLSKKNETELCSSLVFLYTSYLDNFSHLFGKTNKVKNIEILWSDPVNELRGGESKTFDSGTPLFFDILPHVISILSKLLDCKKLIYKKCLVARGGARIEIFLENADNECKVTIERNAKIRCRDIFIKTNDQDFHLNFSTEPGLITYKNKIFSGDSLWDKKVSPLTKMILDFIDGTESKIFDSRLKNDLALSASKINDQIDIAYSINLYGWFKRSILEESYSEESMIYFMSELIQRNHRKIYKVDKITIDKCIRKFKSKLFIEQTEDLEDYQLVQKVNEVISSMEFSSL